ncbi:MAG: hypothetical protein AB1798_01205, partial [Spirochaetota bacterium]
FYVPSLIKREFLNIAVSTSGKIPYFAKCLRLYLEKKLYPGIGDDLKSLAVLRTEIIAKCRTEEEKKSAFEHNLKPIIDEILGKLEGR